MRVESRTIMVFFVGFVILSIVFLGDYGFYFDVTMFCVGLALTATILVRKRYLRRNILRRLVDDTME